MQQFTYHLLVGDQALVTRELSRLSTDGWRAVLMNSGTVGQVHIHSILMEKSLTPMNQR
jgi:hypothetical protein